MKIGIYTGSFAPVHKGHIKIVKEILKAKLVDKILIVPTKEYWDKKINYSLLDRINMLKMYETKKILIDTKHNKTDSTFELLTKLQKQYKKDEIYLILGADNLTKFENWINYKEVLKYPFVIIKRDKQKESYIKNRMIELKKENYIILDIPNINISSTYIRDNISKPNKLKDKIDLKILNYIIKNNLNKLQ